MSLSLLNEYDSSDSEEDPKSSEEQPESSKNTSNVKNFFIGSSSSDSEDSSDLDYSGKEQTKSAPSSSKPALPKPEEIFSSGTTDTSSVSVFRNPFLEAERSQISILEQHVKLTEAEAQERRPQRKSNLPCRQFKRGRCRLGEKCRFVHSIIPAPSTSTSNPDPDDSEKPKPPAQVIYDSKAVRYTEWGKEEIIDDEDEGKKSRKRRVGVTNSLVPPKKALANYEKQRRSEAPWSVNQK